MFMGRNVTGSEHFGRAVARENGGGGGRLNVEGPSLRYMWSAAGGSGALHCIISEPLQI